ncbi:antibiotic biosynthesis monooxygenase [Paraflavisolibacter sp. H34]|uniref:antibiotic biosynthesis monooxygenase family protein n=1 Tax=Huijunlia imazamoxiresistens TaxID=3127457 RepID=UPI00301B6404
MILEVVTIDIREGANTDFEAALEKAQSVISQSKGYLGHEFQKCIEQENRYLLLIRWQTLEDHTVGFRESDLFVQWRGLIGPYFQNPPFVQHYELKFEK